MLYYAHACMTSIHGSIEVIVLVARSKQQYRVSAQRTSSNSNQEDLMSSKLEMNQLLSFYSNIHVWEKTVATCVSSKYRMPHPIEGIQSSICTTMPHPIEYIEQYMHQYAPPYRIGVGVASCLGPSTSHYGEQMTQSQCTIQ